MADKYELHIQLKEPVSGYWDGGKKDFFIFRVSNVQQDKKGYFAQVGSWEANFWFNVGAGKLKLMSEKSILANALKSQNLKKIKQLAKSIKIVKL